MRVNWDCGERMYNCTSHINEKHKNDALLLVCEIPAKHVTISITIGIYKLL